MSATDPDARLRAVFAAYGWDHDRHLATSGRGFDVLQLLNTESDDFSAGVGGIHARKWERFGNSVVQLGNISALAVKYAIPVVYYEREHEFFDAARLTATTGVPFVRKPRKEFRPADGPILSGCFFFDRQYRLFANRERQAWVDRHVLPLLPAAFTAGHPLVTADSITVHFRGGDVFTENSNPTNYGQPPLAYYKLAADASGARRVIVVCEDLANPATEPFIAYLRATGREVVLQSSDLRSDLTLLFNSAELVSGTGSFLWAVQALSRRLQRFWYFHRPWEGSPLARPDVRVNAVRDDQGDYLREVMSYNWINTEEQRRLLLTYPAAALSVQAVG